MGASSLAPCGSMLVAGLQRQPPQGQLLNVATWSVHSFVNCCVMLCKLLLSCSIALCCGACGSLPGLSVMGSNCFSAVVGQVAALHSTGPHGAPYCLILSPRVISEVQIIQLCRGLRAGYGPGCTAAVALAADDQAARVFVNTQVASK